METRDHKQVAPILEELIKAHGMFVVVNAVADAGEANRKRMQKDWPDALILDRNWDACMAALRQVSWMIMETTVSQ
jgi:hypothetical protein